MIDNIEININNGALNSYSALVSFKNNYCFCNDKKYNIDEEFKGNVVRIIRTWEHEYGNSKNIDDEEFKIVIMMSDNKKEVFHGKGVFPKGYRELIKMLGDLHG